MICAYCGGKFKRKSNRGTPPMYCTPAHRQRAQEDRRRQREFKLAPKHYTEEAATRIESIRDDALARKFIDPLDALWLVTTIIAVTSLTEHLMESG